MKSLFSHAAVRTLFTTLVLLLFTTACGPVVITSRQGPPPPPWFYPNRVELVRYIYFPDLVLYYDLRTRMYVFLDDGVWVRRPQLPARYRTYDLRRQRYRRIPGYDADNIRNYHDNQRTNSGRSNRSYRGRSGSTDLGAGAYVYTDIK